jgi:glycine/D-amino acid oxidase-like deaminating enzyme
LNICPGLIGISKDLQPIAGKSSRDPSIYYVSGATGLTWAAALGTYTVQHLLDGRTDFDALFSPDRAFPLGNTVQRILGKRVTFALSNLLALYR